MFINIQTIQGDNYSLDIGDDSFVSDLKKILSKKLSVIEERINLIYCGNLLTDYIKISEYDIESATIIHMIIKDEREYSNICSRSTRKSRLSPRPTRD